GGVAADGRVGERDGAAVAVDAAARTGDGVAGDGAVIERHIAGVGPDAAALAAGLVAGDDAVVERHVGLGTVNAAPRLGDVTVGAGQAVPDGDAVEGDAAGNHALDVEDAVAATAVDDGRAAAGVVDAHAVVVDLEGAVGAVVGAPEQGQLVDAGKGEVDGV